MPRNQVFISYSHNPEDQAILREFQIHLKPWERTTILDVWSDQKIKPSDDWHLRIHEALAGTAIAILFISPEFLASDYIANYELPYLLRASEEDNVKLVPFYVRQSRVNDLTVPVELSSGEKKVFKLTAYQGFNDPKVVVASLRDRNQRDEIYSKAAADLTVLVAPPTPPRSPTGRYELTVQFKRNANQLTRIYLHQYGRFAEYRSSWQPTASAFDLLFGSQEQCEKILALLFDTDKNLARPIRHPVRVRLHTTDPDLATFPWAQMAWEGNNLCAHGWTFELINDRVLEHFQGTSQSLPDITLKAPCPVLLIAPSDAPDVEVHLLALEERLKNAWQSPHEPPRWARNRQEVEAIWKKRKPRIVYYYGPAASDGATLTLSLDSPNGATPDSLTYLAHLWQSDPPQIFFANLIGKSVSPATAPAVLNVPLVITQNEVDPSTARRTALEWLHTLLEGNEDTDPVWAFQQYGSPMAVAWGGYGKWTTRTIHEPTKDTLAHVLLDRKQQRALGHDAVRELVRDGERRVCSVLAYGAEGNLAALFAEQLHEHLRRNAKEVAQVHRVPLRLPTAQSFNMEKLVFEVHRHLGRVCKLHPISNEGIG